MYAKQFTQTIADELRKKPALIGEKRKRCFHADNRRLNTQKYAEN